MKVKKICPFCESNSKYIDYLNADFLRRFITYQGRISYRKRTGVCAKHQRKLAQAIKRARHLALLPFVQR